MWLSAWLHSMWDTLTQLRDVVRKEFAYLHECLLLQSIMHAFHSLPTRQTLVPSLVLVAAR